jgi:hypothetical protein
MGGQKRKWNGGKGGGKGGSKKGKGGGKGGGGKGGGKDGGKRRRRPSGGGCLIAFPRAARVQGGATCLRLPV